MRRASKRTAEIHLEWQQVPSRDWVLEAIEGLCFMLNEMGATGSFNSFGLIKDCMEAHQQLEDQLEGYCKDLARDQLVLGSRT